MKEIICFDFDGVINSYTSGWQADDIITDEPMEGIRELLEELKKRGFSIYIMSCRSGSMEGRTAMWEWLKKYNMHNLVDHICAYKPPALVYVDDRGMNFNGSTEGLLEKIVSFQTWWERKEGDHGREE